MRKPAKPTTRRRFPGKGRYIPKKKVCQFCVNKVQTIDYKDVALLRRFISDRGRMEPRRKTGVCPKHQRVLSVALKRARHVALLPYTAEHIRQSGGPGPREFSPKGLPKVVSAKEASPEELSLKEPSKEVSAEEASPEEMSLKEPSKEVGAEETSPKKPSKEVGAEETSPKKPSKEVGAEETSSKKPSKKVSAEETSPEELSPNGKSD
jgi:small subunit ribosomal protein S18